jgi:hypothetical protein
LTFLILGAAGGSFRGLVDLYNEITRWQQDRRIHRLKKKRSEAPRLKEYVDAIPDTVAGLAHIFLGAMVGLILGKSGQVSGAYGTILAGAAAPALLTQLGQLKVINNAIAGSIKESVKTVQLSASERVSE